MHRFLLLSTFVLAPLTLSEASAKELQNDVFSLCLPKEEPVACVEAEAQKGNKEAIALMGYLNLKGIERNVNREAAQSWYQKGAALGDAECQYQLCKLQIENQKNQAATKETFEWCQKAAAQGHVKASVLVAYLAYNGEGTEKDEAFARATLEAAVQKGSRGEESFLADFYLFGSGGVTDPAKAAKLYLRAFINEERTAMPRLSQVIKGNSWLNIKGCAGNKSPIPCVPDAAATDDAEAQFELGLLYASGDHVEQDQSRAFKLFQDAAKKGHAQAQYHLGNAYRHGRGTEQDLKLAFEWTMKSAQQGTPEAQTNIGDMYMNGVGVEKDYAQAIEWTKKAMAQGKPVAKQNMGEMYEKGLGVEKDLEKAKQLYREAADEGAPNAFKHFLRLNQDAQTEE